MGTPIDTINEIYIWSVLNGYHSLSLWLWDKSDEGCERLMVAEEITFQLQQYANQAIQLPLAKFHQSRYKLVF